MTAVETINYRDIAAIIDAKFPEFTGHVDEHTAFDDLDFDSLVLVELGVVLSKVYGVQIEEEQMIAAETFEGVARLVNDLRP